MMKTIILGAGIIGVMSAYFLRKSGHDVIVIDRQPDVALETSFANGGQISVCYSEPWSNYSNLKKMAKWIFKEDSPILFKPHLDINQWKWGIQFLKECHPSRNHQNIISMLKIATYSRQTIQQLRKELNLEYNQITQGILTYYTSEKSFNAAKKDSQFMIKYGCNRVIKNKNETFEIEPSLKYTRLPIVGSDYTEDDESGDAHQFTKEMRKQCELIGVEFIFDQEIISLVADEKKESIKYLLTTPSYFVKSNPEKNNDRQFPISDGIISWKADNFVCCLGSYTSPFLRKIGLDFPIYPAKGYSATINILNDQYINNISLTDSDKKIVFTKLGNKLRIAGTAEFNGYNLSLNKIRCEALIKRAKELYVDGLDYKSTSFWTGLRPATLGNVPIIGKTKINNLFINSGHGTLGWTMGAGSGKLISQIINQQQLYNME